MHECSILNTAPRGDIMNDLACATVNIAHIYWQFQKHIWNLMLNIMYPDS